MESQLPGSRPPTAATRLSSAGNRREKERFVWVLDATEAATEAASLARRSQVCVRVLAAPETLTPDRVAQLAECLNVVVALLPKPELTPMVCHAAHALETQQMLYMLILVDDTCAEEAGRLDEA